MRISRLPFAMAILIVSMFMPSIANAANIRFPAAALSDTNQIRVLSANGTDVCSSASDASCLDTDKFQKAITAMLGAYSTMGKFLYIPNGTYYIDKTLNWKYDSLWWKGLYLVGESREGTIIKLRSGDPTFGDTANPVPMIKTGLYSATTNSSFYNYIRNLTLDVGANNPGAIGIDFMGNNNGGIQDVTIKSSDSNGKGKAGLALINPDIGPVLFKNLRIDGFDYGIWSPHTDAMPYRVVGNTFEHIELNHQRVAGIYSKRDIMHIRDLQSNNSVPAIQSHDDEFGLIVLLDSYLSNGNPSKPAIQSGCHMFIRNLQTSGYQRALSVEGDVRPEIPQTARPETAFGEFTTYAPFTRYGGRRLSLNLPIQETPEYFDENMDHWYVVPAPDTSGNGNDSLLIHTALQAAASAGKTTLFFSPGVYHTNKTVLIPGGIKHVLGSGTSIACVAHFCEDTASAWPLMEFAGTSTDLRIENLQFGVFGGGSNNGAIGIKHNSARTLTLSRVAFITTIHPYKGAPGAGDLFLEDTGQNGGWEFSPGQNIWARQFDIEGNTTGVVNNGANFWVLGLKTEMTTVVMHTKAGGKTEILGGFLSATEAGTPPGGTPADPGSIPAFLSEDSHISLTLVDSPRPHGSLIAKRYNILAKKILNGITTLYEPVSGLDMLSPDGTRGSFLPLYLGGPNFSLPAAVIRPLILRN